MATITPKLTLTSNASGASSLPGPLSVALALNNTINISVDVVDHFTIKDVRTAVNGANDDLDGPVGQVLIDGSDFTASSHSNGSVLDHHGCWVYVANITAITSKHVIAIGHTSDADVGSGGFTALVDADNNTHADAGERLFSLRAGEFAFFPYDYTGDLYAQATGAAQSLEFWRFDRVQ
jgi:hypothetical protein